MRHALLIACVCLALCAGGARADWTATSTLTNFRVNLTDLALEDGLAPALYYQRASNMLSVNLNSDDARYSDLRSTNLFPTPPATLRFDGANASLLAQTLESPLGSHVSVSGSHDTINTWITEGASAFYSNFIYLALAPRTAVTLVADMAMSLDTDGRESPYFYASAETSVTFSMPGQFSTAGQSLRSEYYPGGVSMQRQYLISLSNDSDELKEATFRINNYVNLIPVPVPEPASSSLMLAGLMVLPLLRRRNR